MSHTPSSNRVRGALPEASPFSSVLARLPDLSPPRTKYTTSFSSLNPMASPPPANTFGFRHQSAQTPGGSANESKPIGAFELLGTTPIKSLQPAEPQLSSPRYDLQSPKFPLFQPSPRKPLGDQATPPSVCLADSSTPTANGGRFASPFGSLLDGSSRSGLTHTDGSASADRSAAPRQQRFAALFAQAGGALDAAAAALGTGDIPPPSAGLNPSYLSPLRPPVGTVLRGTSSSGSGQAAAGVPGEAGAATDASPGTEQRQQSGVAAGAVVRSPAAEADAEDQANAEVAAMLHDASGQRHEEEDEEGEEEEHDTGGDEHYSVGNFRRSLPPPHRTPAVAVRGAGLSRQQQLIQARQQRRRVLQFGTGSSADEDEEMEPAQLVRTLPPLLLAILSFANFACKVQATLPQSPMCQPVKLVEALLPIPRLRDPSDASEDASGSPVRRQRISSGFFLDSPAVQAATHAAVAAALEASAGAGIGISRRPARAAAAGAAAAAKAAAEAAGTPMQLRGSVYLARSSSGGAASLDGVLPPITPADDGPAGAPLQAVFAGPKKCNCKKSKCLKLYCDCFANGGYCSSACSCSNCANKAENRDLVHAQRESIKQRNPNAFIQKIEADSTLGGQHRRGCNCKKSHCMKKYCECFQAGVPCGEHCKCESCHNTAGHTGRRPPGGGASKRARSSVATRTDVSQRQHATRLSATAGGAALAQQYKAAHVAAALHAAMAQATAGLAAAAGGSATVAGEHGNAAAGSRGDSAGAQPTGLFPLLQPGVLKVAEGGAPLMIPIMLQQPGGSGIPPLPPPLPSPAPATAAAPALVAFQAADAAAAAGSGAGTLPAHSTPVAALLGCAAIGALPAGADSAAKSAAAAAADTFSFHPAPTGAGSGRSSGQSTPRATAAAAAAAAADFAFSLDAPVTTAGAAMPAGASALEKLLPAADAGGAAAAAAAAAAAGAHKAAGRPAGVRTTPTKHKPARTMTAALS